MNIELKILDWFQTLHTPVLDKFMVFVTSLGNAGILWIVLTVLFLTIPKMRKTGAVMAAALIIDALLCNVVLKNLVARTRPYDVNTGVQLLVSKLHDYSFPSGHTAASFASVAALYFAGEKKLWKPTLVLACLIAISRLYLYVHYPTDILGGVLLGLVAGYLGYKLVRLLENKISGRKNGGEQDERRKYNVNRTPVDDFSDPRNH
ncbi:phosphatase PAP2 family protein [Blautia sp. MSJ-19]|uniref:phosphatase PAP2 family protein n=1 Tax=Blautia sp. MSJ-19 TaxID=2841517 RepID=UPI001C0F2884|nr:phosphatase PAP2 family protein [Blautia sp. MSJ-19]MBU5480632.1 phosphatase PAP2 family protein [Blautia sp. MSJ-19]